MGKMKTQIQNYGKNPESQPDLDLIKRKPYTRVDDNEAEFIHIKHQVPYPNPNFKPDLVSIEVPNKIAKLLQKMDFSLQGQCDHLEMILDNDVFSALWEIILRPHDSKKVFDDVFFRYLSWGSSSGDAFYDEETHDFYSSIQYLLTCCMDHVDGKKRNSGGMENE